MNYPNYSQTPQYNGPVAAPASSGGSRSAAVAAAVLASIMLVLHILFVSPLNEEIGKLLLDITKDGWGATIIVYAFYVIDFILGILLAINIIKMTKNNAGTIAGSIYLFIKVVLLIAALFLLISVIAKDDIGATFFSSKGFNIARNIILILGFIAIGILLGQAVKGAAGKTLMAGYVIIGVLTLAGFILGLTWDGKYKTLETILLIVGIVECVLALIITIGYYMNISNYSNQQEDNDYTMNVAGQPMGGQQWQRPQQPQQPRPQQPLQGQPSQQQWQRPQQPQQPRPQQPQQGQPRQQQWQRPQQPQQPRPQQPQQGQPGQQQWQRPQQPQQPRPQQPQQGQPGQQQWQRPQQPQQPRPQQPQQGQPGQQQWQRPQQQPPQQGNNSEGASYTEDDPTK